MLNSKVKLVMDIIFDNNLIECNQLIPRRLQCLGYASNFPHAKLHPSGIAYSSWNYDKPGEGSFLIFCKSWNLPFDFTRSVEELFLLCRKYFLLVTYSSEMVQKNPTTISIKMCEAIRNDISVFLNYILLYLKCYRLEINDEFIKKLLNNLNDFRLLLGRFINTSQIEYFNNTFENPNEFKLQRCHNQLEIRWLLIEIGNELKNVTNGNQDIMNISAEARLLTSELFLLSKLKFQHVNKEHLLMESPFHCVCIQELWHLLMHSEVTSSGFWKILQDVIINPELSDKKINSEFALWLLSNLAVMHKVSSEDMQIKFQILDDVLSKLFDGEEMSELAMRNVVRIIEIILSQWGHLKSDAIILLWEFFQNKFNSSFFTHGTIGNLCIMSKDVSSFANQIKSRLDKNFSNESENSYSMFLRLLAVHLTECRKKGIPLGRLTGRIFLKFPVTRVDKLQGLLDIGLYNLSSLFLTLALGLENSSTIYKLVELLSSIPRSDVSLKQLDVVWKSYGACLLLLVSDLNSAGIDDCIRLIIAHADWCIEVNMMTPLKHLFHAMGILLQAREIPNILKVSGIIGPWIEKYLKVCSTYEASHVLEVLLPIIETFSRTNALELKLISNNLINILLPKLSAVPNKIAAEIAGYFAIMSSKDRSTIFQFWIEHHDASIAATFITTLLKSNDSLILMQYPQLPVVTMQAWIRCFMLNGNSKDTQSLVEFIKGFSHFKGIVIDWSSDDPLVSLINFYCDKYSSYETFAEKAVLRDNFTSYFHKLDKWIETLLKNVQELSSDVISRIYYYTSLLVCQGYPLIYTRSNPRSLLKGLIDVLLLPTSIYNPQYKPHTFILKALYKYLPLFITGLALLDEKSDAYINRLLRDIISQYLVRLDSLECNNPHPFVKLLKDPLCCDSLLDIFIQFRNKTMEEQATCAVKLIHHLCSEEVETEELGVHVAEKTLEFVLDLMMSFDDRKQVWNVSVTCFAIFIRWQPIREKVPDALTTLCKKNLAFNATQWFSLVNRVSHLCPEEIRRILPAVLDEIGSVERRRGVVEDSILRQRFEKLQYSIGAKP